MKRKVKNLQTDFIKFHGCGVYRSDGTNVLCTKKRPCSKPINACFWMLGKHVNKKVRTRNREFNDRVLYSESVKTQYHPELYRQKQTQYYSTDESSFSDSDSDSDETNYDSDNNKRVIDTNEAVTDIKSLIKSISDMFSEIEYTKQLISNTVKPHLINEALNHTKQLPEVKNTDQDLGFSESR